eukprot:gene14777-17464_t
MKRVACQPISQQGPNCKAPLKGWVVGTFGTIIFTEDGGEHWIKQDTGLLPAVTLRGVQSVGPSTAFVVGTDNTILRTSGGAICMSADSGRSWTTRTQERGPAMRSAE